MKTTLIQILYLKEIIHWTRMKEMFSLMEGFLAMILIYPLLVILISFFHYAFALMHALFETFMFIFYNKQFKQNLINIKLKINK